MTDSDPFDAVLSIEHDLARPVTLEQLSDQHKAAIIGSLEKIALIDLSKRYRFLRSIERVLRITNHEFELLPGGQRAKKIGFTLLGGQRAEFLCGDRWLTMDKAGAELIRIVRKSKTRRSVQQSIASQNSGIRAS